MVTELSVGNGRAFLGFEMVDFSNVKVKFKSSIPAQYYDSELKQSIKSPEGIEMEIKIPLNEVVKLYLWLKTPEKYFSPKKDDNTSIVWNDGAKRIAIYKKEDKPFIVVKGVDYSKKLAGISYIDMTLYIFPLFLSYLKTFLQKFPVLTYNVDNDVSFVFDRENQLLTVMEKSIDKFHYIEKDEINIMGELLDYYIDYQIMFTHSFTPDRNIFIDKSEIFYVNDKQYDLDIFKHIVYLTRI